MFSGRGIFEVFIYYFCRSFYFFLMLACVLSFVGCDVGGNEVWERVDGVELSGDEMTGVVTYWRTKDLKKFDLVILDLNNKRKRVISVNGEMSSVEIDESGRVLYSALIDSDGKKISASLVKVDVESGQVVRIENEDPVESKPRLSPGFDEIAYNYKEEKKPLGIKVIDLDSGERAAVECPGRVCMNPKWVSDNQIVFVSDKKRVYSYDFISGMSRLLYEGGEGRIYSAEIVSLSSRDALVFSVLHGEFRYPEGSSVYALDLKSGEIEEIINLEGEVASVSKTLIPDVIMFPLSGGGGDGIYFFNMKTKEKVSVSEDGWFFGAPSWSSDAM